MKKLCILLSILSIFIILPISVSADPAGVSGTSQASGETNLATVASSSSAPSYQPKVIVSSYSINPSPAVAGNELTATVTLKNTSSTEAVRNMTVTVSCESTDFSLQNSSNTFFIDNIDKGGTKTIQLNYKTDLKIPAQQFNITMAIAYDSADATGLTATGTISVIVTQPLRVELQTPQISESVNAGDTLPLTLKVMNMGRSKVYNVRCELSAPGLLPSGIAFIGNMDAGTSSSSEMDVLIGTKIMSKGYTGTDQYGLTNGKITLTYEDENGKVYTQDTTISTTIKPPVVTSSSKATKKQAKTGQWWISIMIGCVVIAGLAAILIIRKKKESHHEDI